MIMFGLNFLFKGRQETVKRLVELNDKLVKENTAFKLDNKQILESNAKLLASNMKLRSINAKRKEEMEALNKKIAKLKETVKTHEDFRHSIKAALPDVDFRGCHPVACTMKCSECQYEDLDCKKYTGLSLCMRPNEITWSCES